MSDCTTSGGGVKPGQRIQGYAIVRELGEGARSRIYLATDPKTGNKVAIKQIIRQHDRDVRFIQQMQNEYLISQKAQHPGLRRCFELFLKRSLLLRVSEAVLVMEYVEGDPLDRLRFHNLRTLVSCFIRAGKALAAMNHAGFIHCDLKPNNILVTQDRDVKVIDLGQACPIGTVKPRIQGTPDFIAPEQVKCWPMTPMTDVFNFGATLYWCLTRKKLPTLFNLERKSRSFLMDERFEKPHDIDPTIPNPLSDLVMECVRTAPSKRPQEMAEVLQRLETIRYAMTPRGQGAVEEADPRSPTLAPQSQPKRVGCGGP